MKHIILYSLIFFITVSVVAQNPNRKYQLHNEENGIFSVVTNDGTYKFQFYTSEIIETSFIPTNEEYNRDSHAVILQPKTVKTNCGYVGNDITFGTKDLSIKVTTEPFQISYYYKDKRITSEKRGYYKSQHEPMEMVKGNIVAETTEKIEFNLSKDEVLYGGGARALGMNRRGYRLPLFNRAQYGYGTYSELLNYTMPIVLSSKKYLIHFDNAPVGYLDLDSKEDNTLTYETVSGRMTYQIVAGDTWYDIMDSYTDLTGKQPMLPRWALGNFSSRFGYHTQKETLETIAKFKEDSIPVDAVILDLYWFGKDIQGTLGNFEFLRDSFPNPEQMIKDLKSQKVETILITEPFVLQTSKKWKEAVEDNILAKDSIHNPAIFEFYFGKGGIIDIYDQKGNDWFKDIYKGILGKGVSGIWGDLGEPEAHPHWVQHETGSALEVHNTYGHDWAKLVYEASIDSKPNKRPFILMRAGYSGSQRYGMVPWSGDVSRSWDGLKPQPEIALQMGMQGLAYMHSDLGGFAGANLNDNLYIRWLQYGVFQPIYRPHAHEDVASEPVYRSDRAKRLASFAIAMRYKMLPYNYHLMYENHVEGKPLMRPLFFEEPDNAELYDYSKTYLWGNDMLVSPVLEDSLTQQNVYFPEGSNWYNIENDEMTTGGQSRSVELHPAFIPTYVRGGSFIPLAKPIQSTKEYDGRIIELHYYHDAEVESSKRKLYCDDGSILNPIEKENHEILHFKKENTRRGIAFDFEAETARNYLTKSKAIEFIIHNIDEQPKWVKVEHEKVESRYNSEYKTLTIKFDWDTSVDKEVRIKLSK